MTKLTLAVSLLLNCLLGTYAIKRIYFIYHEMPLQEEAEQQRAAFYYQWECALFQSRPSSPGTVIFLGDSHTENFGVSEFFGSSALNRGIGGDTTGGVLSRLQEVLERKPQKVFLQIGVNDLLQGVAPTRTKENILAIFNRFRTNCPSTKVYVHSLLPTSLLAVENKRKLKDLNSFLRQECQNLHFLYIDLYPLFQERDNLSPLYDCGDHLHLNAKGYSLWAETIKSEVTSEH